MDRMAKNTKQPDVLQELFEALGNDPFIIAECLARSALAERLLTNWYAHDQRIHGELKQRAEAELLAHPTVEQMNQLSGNYSEIELIRSDGGHGQNRRAIGHGVQLNSREWDETVQKLAAMFGDRFVAAGVADTTKLGEGGSPAKAVTMAQIKTGVLSPLQEDETNYYATGVLENNGSRFKLATVSWPKEPLESWLARAESELPSVMAAANGAYTLPTISGGGCIDDTWTAMAGPPEARASHTAVWTGNEMIVWGGFTTVFGSNTGARYNAATDTWTGTSTTDAPAGRVSHTAVWTGSEMIVWGGTDQNGGHFNTGGRYAPTTDSWSATQMIISLRVQTAVWLTRPVMHMSREGPPRPTFRLLMLSKARSSVSTHL